MLPLANAMASEKTIAYCCMLRLLELSPWNKASVFTELQTS